MASFAQVTQARLLSRDGGIIYLLDRLARYGMQKRGTAARYAFPSQTWLGQQLGCRRETICRHVRRLRMMGVLKVTHRRRRQGFWQTNLYVVMQYKQMAWAHTQAMLASLRNRVTKPSPIVPPKRETITTDSARPDPQRMSDLFQSLISDISARKRS